MTSDAHNSAALGFLRISTLEAAPGATGGAGRPSREADAEAVVLSVQDSGTAVITQGDRSTELAPGDMFLHDSARPSLVEHRRPGRLHVFRMPRGALAVSDPDLRRIVAAPVRPGEGGAAEPLSSLLRSIAGSGRPCPPWLGERLAGHAADMLATVVAERNHDTARSAQDSAADTLVARIRRYAEAHLADPGLSPASIAAAHFVSVRYVHKLFAAQDLTLGRWIQRRRLEECRRELAHAGRNGPSVLAVAHRWGFVNAAHFSRAFRRAYGMSPTDWRRANLAPAP
ncbi:helix-turn-helix domain-containing protein [Streptomyces sp. NPDC048664]|uniref:helix-turn-helix domain-containing protein n=1 Tax=Streptomyces sp. NPDC048664 TaxID=3154505 RepID=UPI003434E7A2